MHIDPYIILGSAIIGLLVGMTGAVLWLVFARPWRAGAQAVEEPLR